MMTSRTAQLILVTTVAAVAAAASAVAQTPAGSTSPVAIVASLRGTMTSHPQGTSSRPLKLFDRLADQAVLESAAGAEAVLIFRSGARVRIAEGSRVRLSPTGAVAERGTIDRLPPVPTSPLVAPVTVSGRTVTAVRIRADAITIRSPHQHEITLADATVLEFAPAGETYDVVIEAEDASVVLREHTRQTRIVVPSGVLRPGRMYIWHVTTRAATGFVLRGEGRFHTLSADAAQMRTAMRAALASDPHLADGVMAELDWTLGLVREALAGFRRWKSAGGSDAVVDERIGAIERLLDGSPIAHQDFD